MKKTLLIILTIIFLSGFLFFLRNSISSMIQRDFSSVEEQTERMSPTPYEKEISLKKETESVFVPYWTMQNGINSDEERLMYFGISPTESGVNEEEIGYQNMARFVSQTDGKSTGLTLRMLDQDTNFAILEDPKAQQAVVHDTIRVAKENGFDGIVLDLELKALPFDSVVTQINDFVSLFYKEAKAEDMKFSVLIYGDSFYRVRPFDVKHIAENSDEIMIMAYDFHKSNGNPGPNFPLNGADIYGYDYLELMNDILQVVPSENITIVFGYFGYDWPVDEKNVSIGSGDPLSYEEIESRYIDSCPSDSCELKRDELSGETNVTYSEEDGTLHTVWFEDAESVEMKKQLLKERGINSFSYWAYSYY